MADGDDIGEGSEPGLEGDLGAEDELGVEDGEALSGDLEFGDDAESALDDPDDMDAGDSGAFPDDLEFDDAEGAFPDDFDLGDDGLEDVEFGATDADFDLDDEPLDADGPEDGLSVDAADPLGDEVAADVLDDEIGVDLEDDAELDGDDELAADDGLESDDDFDVDDEIAADEFDDDGDGALPMGVDFDEGEGDFVEDALLDDAGFDIVDDDFPDDLSGLDFEFDDGPGGGGDEAEIDDFDADELPYSLRKIDHEFEDDGGAIPVGLDIDTDFDPLADDGDDWEGRGRGAGGGRGGRDGRSAGADGAGGANSGGTSGPRGGARTIDTDVDLWGDGLDGSWEASKALFDRLGRVDPFAAPVEGGLEDETTTLGDPFATLGEQEERSPATRDSDGDLGRAQRESGPEVTPTGAFEGIDDDPADFAEGLPIDDGTPAATAAVPTAEQVTDALEILRRNTAERRSAMIAEADSPDLLMVEEVLHDSEDRRVILAEFPALGELEILELPDEEQDLAALASALSREGPADEYVFFEADGTPGPRGSVQEERRSALESLSREPVILAELLVEADEAPIVPLHEPAVDEPVEELAVDDLEEIPTPSFDARPSFGEAGNPFEAMGLDRLGVPFLGVVPPHGPSGAMEAFPEGSLPHLEDSAVGGPAILPLLPFRPAPDGDTTWPTRLARFLREEIAAEGQRPGLAMLLQALGRIRLDVEPDPRVAVPALGAARTNDPSLWTARWMHHVLLEAADDYGSMVVRIARGAGADDGDQWHAAGHVALRELDEGARSEGLWKRAPSTDVAPALARYFHSVGKFDWGRAADAVDDLLSVVDDWAVRSPLVLERARLAEELGDLVRLQPLFEGLMEACGGIPAVSAALERAAMQAGVSDLHLESLRARFDRASEAYEQGLITQDAARSRITEVFYKGGRALERAGRRAEALSEFENALRTSPSERLVLRRAARLAHRLGEASKYRSLLEAIAEHASTPTEKANAYYQMGLLARQVLSDDGLAARDFERALDTLPTFTPALVALARIALRQGRYDRLQQRYLAEIVKLEEALGQPQSTVDQGRTVVGLVSRYYRLARLLEETNAFGHAAELDKRALALSPDHFPALLALSRTYSTQRRWRELAALYLGWIKRSRAAPYRKLDALLTAADVVRARLGDSANAARLYARALAIQPDNEYALRRASETFAATGDLAAFVEVNLRWGDSTGGRLGTQRLVRAGALQELDGDSLTAATAALPIYREALTLSPGDLGAIEGLLRTAGRLGRAGTIVEEIDAGRLSGKGETAANPLAVAEALLTGGRFDAAADFLLSQRGLHPREGVDTAGVSRGQLDILNLAMERAGRGHEQIDLLEVFAEGAAGAARAELLTQVGALWELSLGQRRFAIDAYRRAVEVAPDHPAAQYGLERVSPPARSLPGLGEITVFATARDADQRNDLAARSEALDALAETAGVEDAIALRAVARGPGSDTEAAGGLFAQEPDRADLAEDYLRRTEKRKDHGARIDGLWIRLPYEQGAGRRMTLNRIIGSAMEAGETADVERAAHLLLEMEPTSVSARLALRRISLLSGEDTSAREHLDGLRDGLRSPRAAAGLLRAEALRARDDGADDDVVVDLLRKAVDLDPSDEEVARDLELRLRAAADWEAVADLHAQRLEGVTDDVETFIQISRALSELKVEQLRDLRGGYEVLVHALEVDPHDVDLRLMAAQLAERLGFSAEADSHFLGAAESEVEADRARARLAYANALKKRGDATLAKQQVELILAENPDHIPALQLLAELLAEGRRWKGVVRVFRRLFELEPEPGSKAERALGIGELFARVYRDPRRAAGWFKRAVEVDPGRARSIWRLLEEVERLPEGSVPAAHVNDAVDRATVAHHLRFAAQPLHYSTLRSLYRLHGRRGDSDAQLMVGQALVWLGLAEGKVRDDIVQRVGLLDVQLKRPLTRELRHTALEVAEERTTARSVFDIFALVLTDLLSEAMPAGVSRLSRRSYPSFQREFRQLVLDLGQEEVELWNGGRQVSALYPSYLPAPAIAVPISQLEEGMTRRTVFALGSVLEGLRYGRLLLDSPGWQTVAACIGVMADSIAPGLMHRDEDLPSLDSGLKGRLAERARRLPRRSKLQLETFAQRGPLGAADFQALAEQVRRTRRRAGLLACGDLGVALDCVVFADADRALGAHEAGGARAAYEASQDAQALLTYALGAEFAELRRSVGQGVD